MPQQIDWGKHGVIAAYAIGIPTLGFAVLAYFRPPDPNHPMSFDFLSKSIVLPLWVAPVLLLGLVIATARITSHITSKRHATVPPTPQATPQLDKLFAVHPTALDHRVTSPQANVNYTAKLRVSFENTDARPVRVLAPRWLTAVGNVSVQCGASPYPGVPYQEGMMEFAYRYQFEEYPGSWKQDKWKLLPSGQPDELAEINVDPAQTFRIWIGLNPCVPHRILEQRRKTYSLGTLILPVVIGSEHFEWKQDL